VNVLKGFQNVEKGNLTWWLQSGLHNASFQHMIDADIISATEKQ
jgi:hypothetical protein